MISNYFELNEAFAAQALPVLKDLKVLDKMDQRLTCTAALSLWATRSVARERVFPAPTNVMKQKGGTLGVATMCIGLGQGISTVFEYAFNRSECASRGLVPRLLFFSRNVFGKFFSRQSVRSTMQFTCGSLSPL